MGRRLGCFHRPSTGNSTKEGDIVAYTINELLIPTNEYTRPGTRLKKVAGVVIHWTANKGKGANAMAHYRYFKNSTNYASAHYFVDSTQILRIIPENEMAYHVGAKTYRTTKFGSYPNNCLVGVEMCINPESNFSETYKRSVWLCADILKRYGLTVNELVRHYDITGKDCPRYFTHDDEAQAFLGVTAAQAWKQFQEDVAEAMNPPKPQPAPAKPTVEEVFYEMSKYFKDVDPKSWSAAAIDKAKEAGLMDGVAEGKFDPKAPVTREMLAVVALRVYEKLNK